MAGPVHAPEVMEKIVEILNSIKKSGEGSVKK